IPKRLGIWSVPIYKLFFDIICRKSSQWTTYVQPKSLVNIYLNDLDAKKKI
ncbi:hypothetical protein HMPREF0322_04480, partial [Desulfitobacterium hafniense DP7]